MGAGLSVITAQYITLGVGAVMFTTSSISAFLVDRAGRRALHLTGLGGMFISAVVITIGLATKVYTMIFFHIFVSVGYTSLLFTRAFVTKVHGYLQIYFCIEGYGFVVL